MSSTVETRELKTRLGRYLGLVKAGRTLIVTNRGRPVAEIRPLSGAAKDEGAVLRELAALGKLTLGTGEPLGPFRRVRVRGRAMAQTVAELRKDRL